MVVGSLIGRRADERRLGEIGPGHDRLHLLSRQSVTIENNRDRVAFEGKGGEHVYLLEAE